MLTEFLSSVAAGREHSFASVTKRQDSEIQAQILLTLKYEALY